VSLSIGEDFAKKMEKKLYGKIIYKRCTDTYLKNLKTCSGGGKKRMNLLSRATSSLSLLQVLCSINQLGPVVVPIGF
jgi:hypothetical protein